jgi:hypothetical protein
VPVNELIKGVTKHETRGEGSKSKARHGFKKEEFLEVLRLSNSNTDVDVKLGIPALFKFSLSMIARLNDSFRLKKTNLKLSSRNSTITAKLSWSKNVREERDCPNQILLGADNSRYCVLLGLGLHIKTSIRKHGEHGSVFHFGRNSAKPRTSISNRH